MLLLVLSWGINQVAFKLALPDFLPLTQTALRSLGGLVLVIAGARLRGVAIFRRDGTLGAGLLMGVLVSIEFVLINVGLSLTTATRAAIFLCTTPFFVALGATVLLGETLDRWQWIGLALSFTGVVLAIGLPQEGVDARTILGDLLTIAGAVLWAATSLLFKLSALARAPAEKTMIYQLAISGPLAALAVLLGGEHFPREPGGVALAAMLYQAVWVVGCTFLIWYMLMRRYAVSKLSAFTFFTPLFGMAAGHLVLHEPLTPVFAAAAALVVGGLVLINRRG